MYSNRLNRDFNYKNMETAMRYSLKYTIFTWVLFLSVASASTKEATNYPATGR